jgi:hypothetical protein
MGWQKATCYGRRSLVETPIGRYKHLMPAILRIDPCPGSLPMAGIIGSTRRARSLAAQQGEVAIAVRTLNRVIDVAKPLSVRVT